MAAIGEVGEKLDRLKSAVYAAKLLAGYAGQTARWKDEVRDAYTDAATRVFQEHHPRAVHAVVEGPDRIQKSSRFAPSEAELEVALQEAEIAERQSRSRARLAVAIYAAQAIPGLLESAKFQLYLQTKDGDSAIGLVWEAQDNAS